MITDPEVILRIVIGAVLGALIGLERERQGQPAGLRTHIILVIGATLAMTLSINLAMQFQPLAPNGDPARLAAQVIVGIGFLGAGAIMRYGVSVKGLTTATSMWTMAIVGLAVGAGYYWVGAGITVMILVVLNILNVFEKRFIQSYSVHIIQISANDRSKLLEDLQTVVASITKSFGSPNIDKNLRSKKIKVEYSVKLNKNISVEEVITKFSEINGVRDIKIN
jgi:putative Mg2+ transporter-C (MgtC) family protein